MNWIIFFLFLVILQYLLLHLFIKTYWKDYSKAKKNNELPSVSILIPARNEEQVLPRLLNSLQNIDYPSEKLEFILADDNSQDKSAEILEKWCEKSENRNFISLKPELFPKLHANGKASALAHMTKQAKGKYLFLSDADCVFNPFWLREGVKCISEQGGMLLGVTQVKGRGWLSKMQEIDWWHTLGIVKVSNDLGFGTTGLGNNMIVGKEELKESGGFEGLPESLTEDLELCRAFLKKGFPVYQQVSDKMLVQTKAEENWEALVRQRKRWLSGVLTLPFHWLFLLGLQALFYPLVFILISWDLNLGICVWLVKIAFQSMFISSFSRKAGQKISFLSLVIFDFYQILASTLSILSYIWSKEISWKQRSYR